MVASWRRMASRFRHGLETAGLPRPLQADTPVAWVTKVNNEVGCLPNLARGLFSTAEARTSSSSSSPKPDVDPPPSKTVGGAVQQAEGLLVTISDCARHDFLGAVEFLLDPVRRHGRGWAESWPCSLLHLFREQADLGWSAPVGFLSADEEGWSAEGAACGGGRVPPPAGICCLLLRCSVTLSKWFRYVGVGSLGWTT